MTVSELIQTLQAIPDQSLEVRLYNEELDLWGPCDQVEQYKDLPRANYLDSVDRLRGYPANFVSLV